MASPVPRIQKFEALHGEKIVDAEVVMSPREIEYLVLTMDSGKRFTVTAWEGQDTHDQATHIEVEQLDDGQLLPE